LHIGIDVTCWINGRGFGRFIRELVGALVQRGAGHEYTFLADRQTAERAELPGGHRIAVGKTTVAAAEAAAADGRRSLGDMWAMRQLVQREALDLVFFPAVYSYFPVGGRFPVLVTFHDVIAETLPHLIFHNRRSRFFWNMKCRHAARRSARVITVSQASKRGLMEAFALPEERVRVITEGPSETFRKFQSDPVAEALARQKHGLGVTERFFLYVGGISPHKNLSTLIEAFALIAKNPAAHDARLVLAGDFKGDVFRTCHADLMALAKSRNISDRVLFPGFVPDAELAHLFHAAEAFVFPSFLEGFGLPAVEAMACGALVVASDRGSLPEVVGDAGILFDPHDARGLADVLRRLHGDSGLRKELRAKSLQRAPQFTWEKSADQLLAVIDEFDVTRPVAALGGAVTAVR